MELNQPNIYLFFFIDCKCFANSGHALKSELLDYVTIQQFQWR